MRNTPIPATGICSALMGLGMTREMLGDIVMLPGQAYLFAVPQAAGGHPAGPGQRRAGRPAGGIGRPGFGGDPRTRGQAVHPAAGLAAAGRLDPGGVGPVAGQGPGGCARRQSPAQLAGRSCGWTRRSPRGMSTRSKGLAGFGLKGSLGETRKGRQRVEVFIPQ